MTILEKHADFLRDFRGDTIYPSTMAILEQLGLLQEFLPIVDFRADRLAASIDGRRVLGPTFSHLDSCCPFIGFGIGFQPEHVQSPVSAGRRR